jgi:hypothetical protein
LQPARRFAGIQLRGQAAPVTESPIGRHRVGKVFDDHVEHSYLLGSAAARHGPPPGSENNQRYLFGATHVTMVTDKSPLLGGAVVDFLDAKKN